MVLEKGANSMGIHTVSRFQVVSVCTSHQLKCPCDN